VKRELLFPTCVFRTSINALTYDKEQLVADMMFNYNKTPQYNKWDDESITHHIYASSDTDFHAMGMKAVKADKYGLIKIYDSVVEQFFRELNHLGNIEYFWDVQNISINTQYMREHHHYDIDFDRKQNGFPFYSFVHYISFNQSVHGETVFVNPTTAMSYDFLTPLSKHFDNQNCDASVYFSDWVLNVKEDEIVFFPSFLKHRVASTLDPNYPRITSAGNISVVTNNYV